MYYHIIDKWGKVFLAFQVTSFFSLVIEVSHFQLSVESNWTPRLKVITRIKHSICYSSFKVIHSVFIVISVSEACFLRLPSHKDFLLKFWEKLNMIATMIPKAFIYTSVATCYLVFCKKGRRFFECFFFNWNKSFIESSVVNSPSATGVRNIRTLATTQSTKQLF